MKKQKLLMLRLLGALFLFLFTASSWAQAYQCRILNQTQVSCNVWEFDVYLQDLPSAPTFEYAVAQLSILLNPDIVNGGSIVVQGVPGSSGLPAAVQFGPNRFGWDAVNNAILVTPVPNTNAQNFMVPTTNPGVRLVRIRVINSVPFAAFAPTPVWNFDLANGYSTKIFAYVNGITNTDITAPASHTVPVAAPPFTGAFGTPVVQNVTGGGEICNAPGATGVEIGLEGSELLYSYHLFRDGSAVPGAVVFGTGGAITFPAQTVAGLYTVQSPSCTAPVVMNGSATISIVEPEVASVSITAAPFAAGSPAVFTAIPTNGGDPPAYQWYVNGVPDYDFGYEATYTIADPVAGTEVYCEMYSTLACVTPSTAVSNTLTITFATCTDPIAYNVTGTGSYCDFPESDGLLVGLSDSQLGVTYTLYKDDEAQVPTVDGTDSEISFGYQTGGTYTVKGIGTGPGICANEIDMNGSAVITAIPVEESTVTIAVDPIGPVCAGTSVTFSAEGVNGGVDPTYEWFVNTVSQGPPSFTSTFNYIPANDDDVYVIMYPDHTCSAGNPESNIITMEVNPLLPVSVSIEVNQNEVCAGTEVTFTASPINGGSEPQYTWYVNGTGTPGTVEFTYAPADGDIVYVELLADVTQTCLTGNPAASGTIEMIVNPLLTPSVSITANPAGAVTTGTMVEFTAAPVNGGVPTFEWFVNGSSVATTNPYSYIPENGDQVYVVMTSTEVCVSPSTAQSNTIIMIVNDVILPPAEFSMTGGGSYCAGEEGVAVGLSGSEFGVTYTLYQDAVSVGSFPGTGAALDFGPRFAGSYTASGTNSAGTTPMDGEAVVIENALPVIDFAPLADVCVGSGDVTLSATPAGGTFSGDGVAGNVFSPSAVGTFDITYNYTDGTTGCVAVPVTQSITVNPYPEAAGAISGASIVTEGDLGVAYSVNPIAYATSYVWAYSGTGVTINGSGAAVTLDFAYGAISGTLSVYGVNDCGDGVASFFDITVEPYIIPCPVLSTWVGDVSEDWFTAENWDPELVPCETTDVIIGEVAPGNYNPTISYGRSAVDCISILGLTIYDGGSLIGQQYLCPEVVAVVERTIQNSNFHLISSPVDAVTFGDVFLPAYWYEVWARVYDEPSGNWVNQTIYNDLHVGQGYSVQMTTAPQTATFTGMLNGYDVTRTLSNMNPSSDIDRVGWNLLGNPFSSAIDWDAFSTGDYDAQVAVWDEIYGNYRKWNGTTGDLPGGIIPSQQGFFVKTATDGAALTIPMAAQVHSPMALYKDAVANVLEISANGNNYGDATFVHFNSNASADFDSQYDAFKLAGLETAPQLYSLAAGYNLSINELPFEGNEVVRMGFSCGVDGTYSLNASGMESFSSSTPILLEDVKLNILQDLRLNPVYSFNYVTNDNENRFNLHFKAATGISDPANSGIFVYSYERTVVINNTTGLNGEVSIFDMTGREIKDANMSSTSVTRINLPVAVGTYIVKVTTAQGTVNQKVFIK